MITSGQHRSPPPIRRSKRDRKNIPPHRQSPYSLFKMCADSEVCSCVFSRETEKGSVKCFDVCSQLSNSLRKKSVCGVTFLKNVPSRRTIWRYSLIKESTIENSYLSATARQRPEVELDASWMAQETREIPLVDSKGGYLALRRSQ